MMRISEIARYKNAEFIQFFERMNQISSNYNLDELQFRQEFEQFNKLTNDLFGLYKLSQSQDLTAELVLLDEKRDDAIKTVRRLLEAHIVNHQTHFRLASEKLFAIVVKHGKLIERLPYGEETLAINKVYAEISSNDTLKEQSELLGLRSYLEHLKATNDEFERVFLNRNRVEAGSEEKILSLREKLVELFKNWVVKLEAHTKVSNNEKYQLLANEIETFITKSNRDFLLRISRIGDAIFEEGDPLTNVEGLDSTEEDSLDSFLDDEPDVNAA